MNAFIRLSPLTLTAVAILGCAAGSQGKLRDHFGSAGAHIDAAKCLVATVNDFVTVVKKRGEGTSAATECATRDGSTRASGEAPQLRPAPATQRRETCQETASLSLLKVSVDPATLKHKQRVSRFVIDVESSGAAHCDIAIELRAADNAVIARSDNAKFPDGVKTVVAVTSRTYAFDQEQPCFAILAAHRGEEASPTEIANLCATQTKPRSGVWKL